MSKIVPFARLIKILLSKTVWGDYFRKIAIWMHYGYFVDTMIISDPFPSHIRVILRSGSKSIDYVNLKQKIVGFVIHIKQMCEQNCEVFVCTFHSKNVHLKRLVVAKWRWTRIKITNIWSPSAYFVCEFHFFRLAFLWAHAVLFLDISLHTLNVSPTKLRSLQIDDISHHSRE